MNKKAITKMSAIIIVAIIAVAAIAGGAYWWFTRPQGPVVNEVLGAFVVPTSGSLAFFGTEYIHGADLAVSEINAAGGIKSLGGAKLRLIYRDTASDMATAMSITEQVCTTVKPAFILGMYASAQTLACAAITEKYKQLLITCSVADAITNQSYRYTFRTTMRASLMGASAVDFAVDAAQNKSSPIQKYAVVYENSIWGLTNAKGVKDRATTKGLTLVADEAHPSGMTDFSAVVARLKDAKPDVVFMVHYVTDAKLFARTCEELGFTPKALIGIAGAGYALDEFVTGAGSAGNYVCSQTSYALNPTISSMMAIAAEYKLRYATSFTEPPAETYQAIWMFKEALELAGSTDTEKIIDNGLMKMDIRTGGAALLGGIKFDSYHDNTLAGTAVCQWMNGKWTIVWPFATAQAQVVFPFHR